MKNSINYCLVTLALATLFFSTTQQSVATERWDGNCRVEFHGTSTFGAWSGTIDTQPFSMEVANPGQLHSSPLSTTILARTDDLSTDSERRDKTIKKAMQSKDHPMIAVKLAPDFKVTETRPALKKGMPYPTVVPFSVELLGQDRSVKARVRTCRVENGVMKMELGFPISMKACGIKAPSLFGVIRVGDTIEVSAFVTLQMTPSFAAR